MSAQIAAVLHRIVACVKEYEQANLPRENDVLAQWRSGRRSAAREIGEWIERVAAAYEREEEPHQ